MGESRFNYRNQSKMKEKYTTQVDYIRKQVFVSLYYSQLEWFSLFLLPILIYFNDALC